MLGGAHSDELLNGDGEKVEARCAPVLGGVSSTPPKSRRPPVPQLRVGRWSRGVVNEVGSGESSASKRLPDLIRREAPSPLNWPCRRCAAAATSDHVITMSGLISLF